MGEVDPFATFPQENALRPATRVLNTAVLIIHLIHT